MKYPDVPDIQGSIRSMGNAVNNTYHKDCNDEVTRDLLRIEKRLWEIADSLENCKISKLTTQELIDELVKRDSVKPHKIIPCEHYAIHRRHVIIEQGVGEATIIVVRKQP